MNVGLLGHGVVGSGVAEILINNGDTVERHARRELKLVRVADLREFDVPYKALFTNDAREVTQGADVDIVVECMGGVEPAFTFLSQALEAGKHCVTSNKELVVEKGRELSALAEKNGVNFLYEASCGGGIPVLHPMKYCLGANHITGIMGILNGTTNFIMTSMMEDGMAYDQALRMAQELGYAEKDPTADVEGHDARRKISILSHIAFSSVLLDDKQYPCVGISRITAEDMRHAQAMNRSIRLVATSHKTEKGYTASVWPHMLPANHPLSGVHGVNNAVLVQGDMVDQVMFYGPGAGKLPTASAVVSDVIEASFGYARPTPPGEAPACLDDGETELQYFVRVSGKDAQAAKELVQKLLPGTEVSGVWEQEIGIVTPKAPRKALDKALAGLEKEGCTLGQPIRYLA